MLKPNIFSTKSFHNNYGKFKAIFVAGGPGSGKDVIVREAISHYNLIEMNPSLAASFLNDKTTLHIKSSDIRKESLRKRNGILINGTTNEYENIVSLKEEFEELGYECMMIYVDVSDDSSKKRNNNLKRMLDESIRKKRWEESQKISNNFKNIFERFLSFDNSLNLFESTDEQINDHKKNVKSMNDLIDFFLDMQIQNETAQEWLRKMGLVDVNQSFEYMTEQPRRSMYMPTPSVHTNPKVMNRIVARSHIQKQRERAQRHPDNPEVKASVDASIKRQRNWLLKNSTETGCKDHKIYENICPSCQLTRKMGKTDSVKDGDVASNSSYIFRTYEQSPVKPKKKIAPKESGDISKVVKPSGVGPEFDTRGSGTVYPMSGLGNVTYSEQLDFSKFRKKMKESIDSPSVEMGVTGGEYGPSNKDSMQSYKDQDRNIKVEYKKTKRKWVR